MEAAFEKFALPAGRQTPTENEGNWAKQAIRSVQLRAGLLREETVKSESSPAMHRFYHRTFQEYLAAVHLISQDDFAQRAIEWKAQPLPTADAKEPEDQRNAVQAAREALWEVLSLACGHLAVPRDQRPKLDFSPNRKPLDAYFLLEALIEEPAGPAGRDWTDVWLAGELFEELNLPDDPDPPFGALKKATAQQITKLIEVGALTPWERAAAAASLAKLGDPRPGVAPRSIAELAEMEFCYVPPGPFWMGDPPKRDNSLKDGYWIARYPVTVAQYDLFAEDGGYTDELWWAEAKDAGVWRPGEIKGEYEHKWREGRLSAGSRFDFPNCPVVNVCWYEALAFTRWLNQWLSPPDGWRFALARETEWEKAARGGEKIPSTKVVRSIRAGLGAPNLPALLDNPEPQA